MFQHFSNCDGVAATFIWRSNALMVRPRSHTMASGKM